MLGLLSQSVYTQTLGEGLAVAPRTKKVLFSLLVCPHPMETGKEMIVK
jgi:hypothetical protein